MSEDQKRDKAPTLQESIQRKADEQRRETNERNQQNAAKTTSSSKENATDHGLTAKQKAACDKVGLDYASFARAAGAVEAEGVKTSSNVEMSDQEKEICNRMGIDHELYKQVSAEIEESGRGPLTSSPKPHKEGKENG